LLEAGFDVVAPNTAKDITSWMFDDREDSATRLLKGFAASIAHVSAVLS
jgi:hypothetical protein